MFIAISYYWQVLYIYKLIFTVFLEGRVHFYPPYLFFFQMKELRHREVKQLVQSYPAGTWQIWDLNAGSPDPETLLLITLLSYIC